MKISRKLRGIIILALLYTVYVAWILPALASRGWGGDPWISLIYFQAIFGGFWPGILFGFLFGLFQDLMSSPFPFHIFSRILVGAFWGMLRGGLGDIGIFFHMGALIATSIAVQVLEWGVLSLIHGHPYLPVGSLITLLLPSALATAFMGLLLKWFLDYFELRSASDFGGVSGLSRAGTIGSYRPRR